MTRTREQYLEDLLEMFLQLADCFTIEGYGHAVARTKEALPDPTIVRNDAGPPTPAQTLRWICERGTAYESKERSEAVARSLEGLTPEQLGELYAAAEYHLRPGLRNVALGLAIATEWRRVPKQSRTAEDEMKFADLWGAVGNEGHAISKTLRVRFEFADGRGDPDIEPG